MPTLTIIQITSVSLSPNPVNINSPLTVEVVAIEQTITLQPEPVYAGEYYSGEVAAQGG